jgi:predicted AlkP superfamily phosphohydrolase/phosphomutase
VNRNSKRIRLLLLVVLLVVIVPPPAFGYIGPGAGFALAGSFFAMFAAILSALLTLVTWPVRLISRTLFGLRALAKSRVKRVVILGLDGMDHGLTETMLEEGKLPHLAALRDKGCFRPLGSTVPPISPVAWSSFQTGVNPGKHNIFDFLTPDLHNYHAKLSSVEIRPPRRVLRLGSYQIPLGGASVRLLRKSRPFWNVLSDHRIFSSVLRVPITFPPEKLRGVLLSAMCVPDLRGTQGMFAHYTTRRRDEGEKIGGDVHIVIREGDKIKADLIGPDHPFRPNLGSVKTPFEVTITRPDRARIRIDGAKYELKQGKYTEWVRVGFRVAPGIKVHGICKFLLLQTEPEFGLYVTPVNIDPEKPAMPVGYPAVFSKYLAKRQGTFATLGLAEDTWALNEHVINDDQFIEQCLDADREREAMFFDVVDKVPHGLVVCVFDGTDRLQHTFWRDIDERHPARPEQHILDGRDIIGDLYRRMDDLVGKTVAKCDRDDTLLMVISDHGFGPFRRGIDLNRWLLENGYLALHEGRGDEDHLAGVDWARTRAFAIGLSGIYINLKDKFSQGIVEPGVEADRVREEIAERLTGLVDQEEGESAVKRVYIASKFYLGPYKENGPDLIPGYQRGYRVSWETAIGRTTDRIFHPNTKAWSGDHCVDPSLVPGILFCNRVIEEARPRLLDIGPTVLQMFGVPSPEYMDGKALTVGEPGKKASRTPERQLTEVKS